MQIVKVNQLIEKYFYKVSLIIFAMSKLHDFLLTHNYIGILHELLRGGEDPNSRGVADRTPLHIAVLKCEQNPEETDEVVLVIRELINAGANVNIADQAGCTPLHLAVMCRNCSLIETLLELCAEVKAFSNNEYSSLHYATKVSEFPRDGRESKYYHTEIDVVKILLSKDADVDFRNYEDETPLMFAVQDDNYHIVRELLKNGASVNVHDASGSYIMHHALNRDEVNVRIVVELARHGGTFHVTDSFDRTPVVCYLERLIENSPLTDVDNVRTLFRLFMLRGLSFKTHNELSLLETLDKINNLDLKFAKFLDCCYEDTQNMVRSVLVPKWNVSKVARSLVFTSNYKIEDHIPYVVLDRLLKKLLKEKFPMYSEVLVSGIERPYFNNKFAEICNKETSFSFFEIEELLSISNYLTNVEMLGLMFACLKERSSAGRLSRCSIM